MNVGGVKRRGVTIQKPIPCKHWRAHSPQLNGEKPHTGQYEGLDRPCRVCGNVRAHQFGNTGGLRIREGAPGMSGHLPLFMIL
jgi:hypothetical protein